LTRLPIAHRGLHDLAAGAPENSLAAFAACCRAGFPAELDVRLSRDGRLVVFHDRGLERMTGVRARVEDLDAHRLTALELKGTGERIPLLHDVLDLVAGRVPLLVELKCAGRGSALEWAALAALAGYRGELAIQSFRRRSVRHVQRGAADVAVGHLSRGHVLAPMVRPAFHGCHVARIEHRAVQRRRAAGAVVLAWTVRSPAQERWARDHADNVIFEGYVPSCGDRVHQVTVPRSAAGASR
jgi:glycerophosphoryl diester phosphodiesterase